jgi:hypothetical protein
MADYIQLSGWHLTILVEAGLIENLCSTVFNSNMNQDSSKVCVSNETPGLRVRLAFQDQIIAAGSMPETSINPVHLHPLQPAFLITQ